MCCPHEWLLIASRPGQGLGLVGPPSRTRFDRLPLASAGATGSFLVQFADQRVESCRIHRGLERLKGSLDRPCLPFDGEVVTMGCCGARTSQAEAGDQEFQSGPRYHSLTAVGLAWLTTWIQDVCFLHTHQILKPSANHANCHRTRNNRKSHDKHDTMRNTILLDQNLYMFKSICFQRVHWLSIVSRTCRRSQRATSIALWLPRRRQETTANGTFA